MIHENRWYPSTVTLIKRDGAITEGIKARVDSSKEIYVLGSVALIEPGDLIERYLSNGAAETYEVVDPEFHEAHPRPPARWPAYYRLEVRKLGVPEGKNAGPAIISNYNITGNNPRINQNSVDQSVNIVQSAENQDMAAKFEELRQEIKRYVGDESQQSKNLEVVDAIEGQFKSGSPKRAVVEVLIQSLPLAGNIGSLGSFILSCLS